MHIVICLQGGAVSYLLLTDGQYREMSRHGNDPWPYLASRLDEFLDFTALIALIDEIRNRNCPLLSETVVESY